MGVRLGKCPACGATTEDGAPCDYWCEQITDAQRIKRACEQLLTPLVADLLATLRAYRQREMERTTKHVDETA